MIEINNVSKSFDDIKAIHEISLTIKEGQVFGLVGTNGAGKSTLLRMMAGVLKQDAGSISIDGEAVFDNPKAKQNLVFIADDQFFFLNDSARMMADYYRNVYEHFDQDRFLKLLGEFGLDEKRKIRNYSKGMKRQLALLLGICANTKYLFCDESFDGLDPVMRQSVKSLFASDMVERGLTPVIASHNLRELEDICDHVGLLHKGGVLLSEDLENLKLGIQRIQVVFRDGKEKEDAERIAQKFKVLDHSATGKVESFTLRGEEQNINAFMRELEPKYYEPLPLTLEEIFIAETESAGYDIRKLILGENEKEEKE